MRRGEYDYLKRFIEDYEPDKEKKDMDTCEWRFEDKTSYWMIHRGCGNDSRREKRGKAEPPETCPYCKREVRKEEE